MNTVLQATFSNPQAVYKQTSVETASPEKLLIMLYMGTVKFLRQGEKALEEKRYEDAHNHLTRVQDIITELIATLNMEQGGEIAANLRELYLFYYNEVVKTNLTKETAYLQPVIEFFETFRDVWMETAKVARMGAR